MAVFFMPWRCQPGHFRYQEVNAYDDSKGTAMLPGWPGLL